MAQGTFDLQMAARREKQLRRRTRFRNLGPAAPFVLPGLALACVFVFFPMVFNIRISFSDYQIVQRSMIVPPYPVMIFGLVSTHQY